MLKTPILLITFNRPGICWCLENNKDGSLSKVAEKKVMENYTIDRVGKQYAEVYASLV